jgi:hypothetical protein
MLSFTGNDNLQVQGFGQQVKSTPGFEQTSDDSVSKAWDLGKSQAQQNGVNEQDPAYWDTVTNNTKTALGMQLPNTSKTPAPFDLARSPDMPTTMDITPTSTAKTTAQQSGGNTAVVEAVNKVREIQTSGGFSATPENAVVPGMKGKTGTEINSEARRRLELMKKNGFGTSF